MNTVSITQFQPDDFSEIVDLLHRELFADTVTADDFHRKVLLDPNFRPEGALTARANGKKVGFILAILRKTNLEDALPDFDRGWITLFAVDRNHRRMGIGGLLLDGALKYLQAGGAKSAWVSPYAPNYFMPGVDEAAYPDAIDFLKKHGFQVAYRPLSMEAHLTGFRIPEWVREIESMLADEGTVIGPLQNQDLPSLMNLLHREFPGDWQRLVRETTGSSGRIFTAMKGNECLGFSRHAGERFGPFGVAPSARAQGIGAVLLAHCLLSMRNDGLQSAWFMWTDDHAARLYSRLGFQETRRFSVMKKEWC